jgi:pseudouridine-5'-phosphate glycosidase
VSPDARNVDVIVAAPVRRALRTGAPVVALESTVITHGLPSPQNIATALELEAEVRLAGAIPATVGVIDGKVHVGMPVDKLERLAGLRDAAKLSTRDLAAAVRADLSGGTTVAATMLIASRAGILVFATGGIGGVHRENHSDVSADLAALATTRMIVVCAGAKAILDLPATVEYLETLGVPLAGFETDEFPAFYSRQSGLRLSLRLDSPAEM